MSLRGFVGLYRVGARLMRPEQAAERGVMR